MELSSLKKKAEFRAEPWEKSRNHRRIWIGVQEVLEKQVLGQEPEFRVPGWVLKRVEYRA